MKIQQISKNSETGFTLIELLASTFVIIVIGSIIIGIIVSTLRGANKTNTMVAVRQNGTQTISQVSKLLRFASAVRYVDGASPSVCVTGESITVETPTAQPTPAAHTSITFDSVDGGTTTLECKKFNELSPAPSPTPRVNEPMTIASNGASLLDVSAVQATSCEITCSQTTQSDSLIVGIKFSLTTIQPTSGALFSEFSAGAAPLDYQTSVILRNVGR